MDNKMTQNERCVVLVTGGAGFLGQHVVGLLQERADHVTEIRVLDVIPYKNKLEFYAVQPLQVISFYEKLTKNVDFLPCGEVASSLWKDYDSKKPVNCILGSVTDKDVIIRACEEVDCVMHVASIVDTNLLPDIQLSHKINVDGTRNVIEACKQNGVKRLIYCSSVEVVVGKKTVFNGTEDNTEITTEHHFAAYGSSKVAAEKLVIEANCDELQTISLRPSVLYGELEWRGLGRVVNTYMAQKLGTYVRFDCQNGIADHVYVGNVAWGFICAEKTILEKKPGSSVCGSSYFIVDDSPHGSVTDYMDFMLTELGLKPMRPAIPLWMILFPLYIIYVLLLMISLVSKVNVNVGIDSFTSLKRIYTFKYDKAKKCLGYTPLYSYEEAKARTVKFLESILKSK